MIDLLGLPSLPMLTMSHGKTRSPWVVSTLLTFSPKTLLIAITLDWHGAASGGMIIGKNYHGFQRFRLVDIARKHPKLFDVGITSTSQWTCQSDCDEWGIKGEYGINGGLVPKEDTYLYKYAVDVDGNSFSGRFVGLLKSGSLVFKVSQPERWSDMTFNDRSQVYRLH